MGTETPATASKTSPYSKPANRKTKLDWTLPPNFATLLARPAEQSIPGLCPLPAAAPITKPLASPPGSAFIDAFRCTADALTENDGHAYRSTDSPLVDLSAQIGNPPISVEKIRQLFEAAYDADPLNAVKLALHTRSIHEGNGFREGFWVCAGWLLENHPRTLLDNLHLIVDPLCKKERSRARDQAKAAKDNQGVQVLDEAGEIESNLDQMPEYPSRPHGTFDELEETYLHICMIDLLVLYMNGQLSANYTGKLSVDQALVPAGLADAFSRDRKGRKGSSGVKRDRLGFVNKGKVAKTAAKDDFAAKILRAGTKKDKHELFANRLETPLSRDPKFQALYIQTVHLFVNQLRADLLLLDKHNEFIKKPEHLRKPYLGSSSPHLFSMSYAAKWVPTPGHGADKQLHIATAIALLMFPGDGLQLAREKLQKTVLSPLRAATKVPESKMGKGEWKIDYTKVPSRAMARHAEAFATHDAEGFEAYLQKVATGRYKISGASLFPHELLMDAVANKAPLQNRLADLQWPALVDSIRNSASAQLENCIAVADVSGSMGYYKSGDKKHPQPINVCIALTLLLGELAAPPWNGMCFTFTSNPAAVIIDTSLPLSKRAEKLSTVDWGMTTNFYKVFDLILSTARREKLKPDQMVKRLFIFSDMQFNQAMEREEGETEYATIKRKFEQSGYDLPELVFWNLATRAGGTPIPVKGDQEGVSLVSGFSGSLMKYFLGQAAEEQEEALVQAMDADWQDATPDEAKDKEGKREKKETRKDDPITTVMKMLSKECFSGVVIVD